MGMGMYIFIAVWAVVSIFVIYWQRKEDYKERKRRERGR